MTRGLFTKTMTADETAAQITIRADGIVVLVVPVPDGRDLVGRYRLADIWSGTTPAPGGSERAVLTSLLKQARDRLFADNGVPTT